MPVLTRSKTSKQTVQKKKQVTANEEALAKEESRCRLLELPPELRNRIYHFAKEMEFDSYEPPPLLSTTKRKTVTKPWNSGRQYLALTQTNKQVRFEFRPLWLRDSSVRIKFDDIDFFVATFCPSSTKYEFAPKLLIISWDEFWHDEDEDVHGVLFDISLLARLRAFCPRSKVEFRPHRLIEHDLPNVPCTDCGHSLYCGCEIDCDHDAGFESAHDVLFDELYAYIMPLNEVMAHPIEAWLKLLRDTAAHGFEVQFMVDTDTQELTLFNYFRPCAAPPDFTKDNMYNGAARFLNEMGFLDFEYDYMVDFVVGRATGRYMRHSKHGGSAVAAYDQVEIPGTTVYEPDTATVTTASS